MLPDGAQEFPSFFLSLKGSRGGPNSFDPLQRQPWMRMAASTGMGREGLTAMMFRTPILEMECRSRPNARLPSMTAKRPPWRASRPVSRRFARVSGGRCL
jgi:hypothetical protein